MTSFAEPNVKSSSVRTDFFLTQYVGPKINKSKENKKLSEGFSTGRFTGTDGCLLGKSLGHRAQSTLIPPSLQV